jgi:hypothetical protein
MNCYCPQMNLSGKVNIELNLFSLFVIDQLQMHVFCGLDKVLTYTMHICAFSSVVRQIPGYNSPRKGTAHTSQIS